MKRRGMALTQPMRSSILSVHGADTDMPKTKREQHLMAGKTVLLNPRLMNGIPYPDLAGQKAWVEDWWVNVAGVEWGFAQGNPAAMMYGLRSGFSGLPTDNEVVYVKVGGLGYIVHQTELGALA